MGAATFLRWTESARVCFANASEAAVLAGTADPPAQAAALTCVYSLAVIKRGAEGAVACSVDGGLWSADAPPVHAVDTSGAGDAFMAGFLASYLRGRDVATCLDAGIRAGSRAVTVLGGRPAL